MRVPSTLTLTFALVLLTGAGPLGRTAHQAFSAQKIDQPLDGLLTTNPPGAEAVRVIVRTRDGRSRESLKRRLRAHGDDIKAEFASIGAIAATVHVDDLRALADEPDTEGISIDAVVTPHHTSTNVLLGTLPLSDSRASGAGVRVAVIDSGLRLTNDLGLNRLLGFYDLTGSDGVVARWPYDDYGHGTHVAGLMAGNGANSNGFYRGIAPAAKVLALKVLNRDGSGYTSDVIQAIEFVIANQSSFRIDVINLALGHPVFESATTDPLVAAVQKATQAGIHVVVAAGNYGQHPTTGLPAYAGVTSPGNAPSAITIGALDTQETVGRGDDTIPVYSSRGPTWYDAYAKPDLVAPGHRLVSVAALESTLYRDYPSLQVAWSPDDDVARYFRLSGTSMATAVTSGTVALMLEAAGSNRRFFTPNLVKALLEWTAIPVAGYDALTQGSGSLNVAGALALVRRIDPTMPAGTYWFTSSVTPSTIIAGTPWAWAQSILWGDTIGYGGGIVDTNQPAWDAMIVWGTKNKDTVIWGNAKKDTVIWGNNVVWDDPSVWSSSVVLGSESSSTVDGATVIWGNGKKH